MVKPGLNGCVCVCVCVSVCVCDRETQAVLRDVQKV